MIAIPQPFEAGQVLAQQARAANSKSQIVAGAHADAQDLNGLGADTVVMGSERSHARCGLVYGKGRRRLGAGQRDGGRMTNGISVDASDTKRGWLVGVGIEYSFSPNWTVRVEWDHIGLGDVSHTGFVPAFPADDITLSRRFEIRTIGRVTSSEDSENRSV